MPVQKSKVVLHSKFLHLNTQIMMGINTHEKELTDNHFRGYKTRSNIFYIK